MKERKKRLKNLRRGKEKGRFYIRFSRISKGSEAAFRKKKKGTQGVILFYVDERKRPLASMLSKEREGGKGAFSSFEIGKDTPEPFRNNEKEGAATKGKESTSMPEEEGRGGTQLRNQNRREQQAHKKRRKQL